MIRVSLMPKRDGSFSRTVISPQAIRRPLTTTSTGSPIRRSSATVEPRCSAISSETDISALPRTICTSTAMFMMMSVLAAGAGEGAATAASPALSSCRTPRSSSIARFSSASCGSSPAAGAMPPRSSGLEKSPKPPASPSLPKVSRSGSEVFMPVSLKSVRGARWGSARHQPVDEFLALIERLADADREVLAELAELASEERLLAGRQPRLALRRLRQLQHLADEEPRQLAQRHARERHRRLQLHRRAHHLF